MSTIAWSEELAVNHPRMDATHHEFVAHLQQVDEALNALKAVGTAKASADAARAAFIQRFDDMVEHTVAHFAQEDRWMLATGFSADNCHSRQHSQVLELLHEVRRRLVEQNELEWVERLMPELVQWFFQHAQAADAGLAYHLGQVGYDTETGRLSKPLHTQEAAGTTAMSGCGSASCAH